MSGEFTLPSGHTVELYEPPSSGREPMRSGSCPGCAMSTYNFTGRYAAIRELGLDQLPVSESPYIRSYGHLECMWYVLEDLMLWASAPEGDGRRWAYGRQRDAIEFVNRNANDVVEIKFSPKRGRDSRYAYRLQENE